MNVADKNTALIVAGFIVAIAATAAIAFYTGRHTAPQAEPSQLNRVAQPNVTRLPPKRFGAWNLACVRDAEQTTHCSLLLRAINERHQLVMQLALVRTPKNKAAMTILTGPNALVANGVTLTPGSTPPVTLPFQRCLPQACEASLLVSDKLIGALSSSDMTEVRFVAGNGNPVDYRLETQGFKDGYAAWQNENPQPPASTTNDASAAPGGGEKNAKSSEQK